jgi:hypothetical protein
MPAVDLLDGRQMCSRKDACGGGGDDEGTKEYSGGTDWANLSDIAAIFVAIAEE